MTSESVVRTCKRKDCQKILPHDYKHDYCESCRNKQAHTAKNVIKNVVITALGVSFICITKGKFVPKGLIKK